jgi:hypothetical protein
MAGRANYTRMDDAATLRFRAVAAAGLAAKSGDREIAKLLLLVSEEMEEDACKLELQRGDPQLEWAAPLAEAEPGVRSEQHGNL